MLDVPLLESPPLSLTDLASADSIATLRDPEVDRDEHCALGGEEGVPNQPQERRLPGRAPPSPPSADPEGRRGPESSNKTCRDALEARQCGVSYSWGSGLTFPVVREAPESRFSKINQLLRKTCFVIDFELAKN